MKLLCKLGIHKWEHYTEKSKYKNDFRKTLELNIRECKHCGKRQRQPLIAYAGARDWKKYPLTKETIRIRKLEKILNVR